MTDSHRIEIKSWVEKFESSEAALCAKTCEAETLSENLKNEKIVQLNLEETIKKLQIEIQNLQAQNLKFEETEKSAGEKINLLSIEIEETRTLIEKYKVEIEIHIKKIAEVELLLGKRSTICPQMTSNDL